MFNLVESMNIRGLFTLLEQQIARTEELHKKQKEKTREIIRLQEHLNTKPTNLTCSTEEQTHTESTRTDTKTRTIENRNADNLEKNTSKRTNSEVVQKQSVSIHGDSMINYQDEVSHSNKNRIVKD